MMIGQRNATLSRLCTVSSTWVTLNVVYVNGNTYVAKREVRMQNPCDNRPMGAHLLRMYWL